MPVDPNAILSNPTTFESLETVAWQHPQGVQAVGGIRKAQPLLGRPRNSLELDDPLAVEQPLGAFVLEAADHVAMQFV